MTSHEIDPYEILQVPHNATDREIKVAYKKLALINHPDRCDNPDETMMALINEAYTILSDPEQRRRYDLTQRFTRAHSLSTAHNFNTARNGSMRTAGSGRDASFGVGSNVRPSTRGHGMNSNTSHFARDPFSSSGGLSNRDPGAGNKGFSFSFTSTSTNALGESKSVRKTTRYREGKRETVVETVTVKPDGTRECDTKVTSEDAVSILNCNPFDRLLPQMNSVGMSLKNWIQGSKNESSAGQQKN